jgi:hypothetical protein
MPLPLLPIVGGSLLLLYWKQRGGTPSGPSASPVTTGAAQKASTAPTPAQKANMTSVGTPLAPLNPVTGSPVKRLSDVEAQMFIKAECAKLATVLHDSGFVNRGLPSRGDSADGDFKASFEALGFGENYANLFYTRMSDPQWVEWIWLVRGAWATEASQSGAEAKVGQSAAFDDIHPWMVGINTPSDFGGKSYLTDFTGFAQYAAILKRWINAQNLVQQSNPWQTLLQSAGLTPAPASSEVTSSGNVYNRPQGNATSQLGGH